MLLPITMAKLTKLSIRRVGFVIKHHQPEANSLALELAQQVLEAGLGVVFATESDLIAKQLKSIVNRERGNKKEHSSAKRITTVLKPKMMDLTDLIVVLGGDGTYLSIARLMHHKSVPVLGVNMGQLGFLTETKRSEAPSTLGNLLLGKPARISERVLLEVTLSRKNKVIFQGPVVNDAVISKGAIARIIGLEVSINDQPVNTFRADGIIASTPTGSTAYALAAGGPILEPSVPAIILAPICPHSLTQRPLVVNDSSVIKICLRDRPGHVLLTLDGQDAVNLLEGDVVTVRRFQKHSLKLISSASRDYFSLLREKLKFGLRD